MASSYLTHTLSTVDANGNKKGTFSAWMKRSVIGVEHVFYNVKTDANNYARFRFNDDDTINVNSQTSGTAYYATTTAKFRDPSAFYHVVITYDTSQSTEADRIKIYVNGAEETKSASNYPSQDSTIYLLESGQAQVIGYETGASGYFDGLISYANYTEGYGYAASDFGETDSSSGIWKWKSPSVTYGTNGFYLKMDTSSPGTDSSGGSNTFTTSGTLTLAQDNASNNFCTLNSLVPQNNVSFSNANNTWTSTTYNSYPNGTMVMSKGKWYYEVKVGGTRGKYGFAESSVPQGDADSSSTIPAYWIYTSAVGAVTRADNATGSNQTVESGWTGWTTNDILGFALDIDNGKFYASLNGTWYNSGDPAAGTGAVVTGIIQRSTGLWLPFLGSGDSGSITNHTNFGNGFFGTTAVTSANSDAAGHGLMEYAVPTGFYTICTKNINEYG
tara:strand:+ start:351 stop:1682 length:1332 start_codon:yes stop_codon:yes gene_type:complete